MEQKIIITFISVLFITKVNSLALYSKEESAYADCGSKTLTVAWASVPPYIYRNNSGTALGGMLDLLESVVQECCSPDTTLILGEPHPSLRAAEENFVAETFVLPVIRNPILTILDDIVPGHHYYPIMQAPGSVILSAPTKGRGTISSSLSGSWPLALLVISSCIFAGIIVWGLETYWNPSDFPRGFSKGFWEGIWWAYVSMTTVGYGDKTPKTVPGRVFGLIWMTVSIIMMSIFTATLVSAFNATEDLTDLKGLNVGVISGSPEETTAVHAGAVPIDFPGMDELIAAMDQGQVQVGLVDHLHLLFYSDDVTDLELEHIGKVQQEPQAIGMIVQFVPESGRQCFAKSITRKRFDMFDYMEEDIGSLTRTERSGKRKAHDILGSTLIVGYTLLAISFLTIILLLIWEFMYYRPRHLARQAQYKLVQRDHDVETQETCTDISLNAV